MELERTLLLQHRPPFNRAGTWQAPPWHLHITATEDQLHLSLIRPEAAVLPLASSVDSSPSAAVRPSSFPEFSTLNLQLSTAPPSSPLTIHYSLSTNVPRSIHATLCRCLIRLHHPDLPLSRYPAGLLNLTAPLDLRLHLPGQATVTARLLTDFLSGDPGPLLHALQPLAAEASPPILDSPLDSPQPTLHSRPSYWVTQVESLQTFAAKRNGAEKAAPG